MQPIVSGFESERANRACLGIMIGFGSHFPLNFATGPSTPFGICTSASPSVLPSGPPPGLPIEVVELVGIVDQIEQFPLILLPEINKLVSSRAHAVVRSCIMVARIVIVTVIH